MNPNTDQDHQAESSGNAPAVYIYTGGSAFPESYIGADMPHEGIGNGMSLRDYFAAKALAGVLANSGDVDYELETLRRNDYKGYCLHFAQSAYAFADAMLKARLAIESPLYPQYRLSDTIWWLGTGVLCGLLVWLLTRPGVWAALMKGVVS